MLIQNAVLDNFPFAFLEKAKPYSTKRHASRTQKMMRIGKYSNKTFTSILVTKLKVLDLMEAVYRNVCAKDKLLFVIIH